MEIQQYRSQWAGRPAESALPTNNLIDLRFSRTRAENQGTIAERETRSRDFAYIFESLVWASLFVSVIVGLVMAFLF